MFCLGNGFFFLSIRFLKEFIALDFSAFVRLLVVALNVKNCLLILLLVL